jgi:hypothetical protein
MSRKGKLTIKTPEVKKDTKTPEVKKDQTVNPTNEKKDEKKDLPKDTKVPEVKKEVKVNNSNEIKKEGQSGEEIPKPFIQIFSRKSYKDDVDCEICKKKFSSWTQPHSFVVTGIRKSRHCKLCGKNVCSKHLNALFPDVERNHAKVCDVCLDHFLKMPKYMQQYEKEVDFLQGKINNYSDQMEKISEEKKSEKKKDRDTDNKEELKLTKEDKLRFVDVNVKNSLDWCKKLYFKLNDGIIDDSKTIKRKRDEEDDVGGPKKMMRKNDENAKPQEIKNEGDVSKEGDITKDENVSKEVNVSKEGDVTKEENVTKEE